MVEENIILRRIVLVTGTLNELDVLNSLDYLVFRFTKAYKNPNIVAEKLKVSIEAILEIYLKYPEYLSLETLLQYVVYNNPLYIFRVLNLPYYKELFTQLTEQEQQLLYISMVKLTNKEISLKEVSRITGLTEEEINNYEITSENEEVNKLNLYLK